MSGVFFSHDELYSKGKPKKLKGKYLREVAFPLGGLGAGCVSLAGDGNLVDWEIFNRPKKGTLMPGAFFAIWARAGIWPTIRRWASSDRALSNPRRRIRSGWPWNRYATCCMRRRWIP